MILHFQSTLELTAANTTKPDYPRVLAADPDSAENKNQRDNIQSLSEIYVQCGELAHELHAFRVA